METAVSKKEIMDYRRRLWRLAPKGRLRTLEQAAGFVDEVGMSLLFACRDIPLPKLYDCATDGANWWAWKDVLQERKRAYNGRLVRHKATLVSMKLLPAFYAVYLTGGGHAMYEEEYYWGKLGQLANSVAGYIERNGPTPVDVLRKATVPPGKANTRRFHSALFELQSKFKIVSVGLEDRSWGVRILDLFTNWLPFEVERSAEGMSRDEAIRRILIAIVNTAGAVPESDLPRLLTWTQSDTSKPVNDLVDAGLLRHGRIRADRRIWLVSPGI